MVTTVLTIVQDFTEKMGLPTPSGIIGSTDKGTRQLKALMYEVVRDLSEYNWQTQKLLKTFVSTAVEDQGKILTIFGAGYHSLVADTMWNDTRVNRIYGPITDIEHQALRNLPAAGPEFQFWISNGHLYITPALTAGETLSVLYRTKYGVLAVDGVTTKERIDQDDDSLLFPDIVVAKCLEYKWRRQKGEAGWEDIYNDYMGNLADNIMTEGGPTLSLGGVPLAPRPGIVIPAGSWNV